MKQLIIVEGPDCSGKSTLAKYLALRLSGFYMHHVYSPELQPGIGDYFDSTLEAAIWTLHCTDIEAVIFDRFWPSEWVYHMLFRRGNTSVQFDRLLRSMNRSEVGVTYVSCKHVPELYRPDPRMPLTADDQRLIQAGYEGTWPFYHIEPIEYDLRIDTHGETYKRIMACHT